MLENLIFSPRKREEIIKILTTSHPSHNQRLYLKSFLANVVHLSDDDIIKLIKKHNRWNDFDLSRTEHQVYGTHSYTHSSFTWDKNHDECKDTSIFSKLNNSFFNETLKTAWEYEPMKFNVHGVMNWNSTQYPIYRVTDGKAHFLYYIDIDSEPQHLNDAWNVAKQVYSIGTWTDFKFSGSKGFHLCKKTNKSRQECSIETKEIYKTVKTNLVSYTTDKELQKPINIDPSSLYQNRFVRGYSINLKSKKYSIPVDTSMQLSEILDISSDLNKIKSYLQTY